MTAQDFALVVPGQLGLCPQDRNETTFFQEGLARIKVAVVLTDRNVLVRAFQSLEFTC